MTDTVLCPRGARFAQLLRSTSHSTSHCWLCEGSAVPQQVPAELVSVYRIGGIRALGDFVHANASLYPELCRRLTMLRPREDQ